MAVAEFQYDRVVGKLIKNEAEADAIFEIMQSNMQKICLYQKHLLLGTCSKYPQISYDLMLQAIDFANKHS